MRVEKLQGNIHVAKVQTQYPAEDYVEIEITDSLSGIQFLEIRLSLAEATQTFLFNGHTDVTLELRNLDLIGKKREVKTLVLEGLSSQNWDEDYERLLSQHEVDGWIARREDRPNHHRMSANGYSVGYTRFVEVKDAEA